MSTPAARATPPGRRGLLVVAITVAVAYLTAAAGLLWWSTVPVVAGWQPTVVLTGSMAPALDPGDVVLVGPVAASPQVLPPGRVALVRDPSRDTGTYLHRVAEWDDGAVVTRGDANATADAPVAPEQVLGQVRLVVPAIGLPAVWLRTGDVLPLVAVLLVTWLALLAVARGRDWAGEGARRLRARHLARPARRPGRRALVGSTAAAVVAIGSLALTGVTGGTVAPWSGTTVAALNTFATTVQAVTNLQWWGSGGAGQGGAVGVAAQWTRTAVGVDTWRSDSGSIATGGDHSCAVRADSTLWCWGANTDGQLGNGSQTPSDAPVAVAGAATWTSVTAGTAHTCGVKVDKTLWCWGRNTTGQLGNSSVTTALTPVQVTATNLPTVVQVSAGDASTCAIRESDLRLYCWGSNASQQSFGNTGYADAPADSGLADWVDVSVGRGHACGIRGASDGPGALYCWGDHSSGQTLVASTTRNETKVGASGWADVTSGPRHTCATATDGTLWCWGANDEGQLGTAGPGTGVPATTPGAMRKVGTATTWTGMVEGSGSADATCARQSGNLWCWGANVHGELGLGQGDARFAPTLVGATATAANGSAHLCTVDTGGTLACAGSNARGQLGRARSSDRAVAPTVLPEGTWSTVAAGRAASCGVRTDGSLWCWGANTWGQLGTGDTQPRSAPAQVGTATTWTSVTVGARHSCALRTDQSLWCWGDNASGQTGTSSAPTTPTRVGTGTYTAISAGDAHTCAINGYGKAACWGDNTFGQLGFNDRKNRSSPTILADPTTWTSLVAGGRHTCGVPAATNGSFTAGSTWCWGSGARGQLGAGTTTESLQPIQAGSEVGWASVRLGAAHTCGLRTDGSVRCWGANTDGQAGTGTTNDVLSPTSISPNDVYAGLALGARHSCGILVADKSVRCWGDNSEGQLGVTTTADLAKPAPVPNTVGTTALAAGGMTTLQVTDPAMGTPGAYLAAVTADNPVALWRLDEPAGTTAVASLGAPDGTWQGAPTLAQAGAVPGETGSSVRFDGVDDRASMGDVHDFAGTAAFSVEFWILPPSSFPNYGRVVSKERYTSATDRGGWAVVGHPENHVSLERYSGAAIDSAYTTALVAGVWSHVVMTYDGSTIRVYTNGALTDTRTGSTLAVENGTYPLAIGSLNLGNYLTGGLDEVALYATALPAERVLAHYQAARP